MALPAQNGFVACVFSNIIGNMSRCLGPPPHTHTPSLLHFRQYVMYDCAFLLLFVHCVCVSQFVLLLGDI